MITVEDMLRWVLLATLLLSLALVTRATLLRRLSASTKHAFGISICLALLCMTLLATATPDRWRVPLPVTGFTSDANSQPDGVLSAINDPSAISDVSLSERVAGESTGPASDGSFVVGSARSEATTVGLSIAFWRKTLIGVYALGLLACWFKICREQWQLTRIRLACTRVSDSKLQSLNAVLAGDGGFAGLSRTPELLFHEETETPFVMGLFRQCVVLPRGFFDWEASQIHCAILHEFAHLSRRDLASQLFVRVVAGVLWFHPLMWMLARRIRDDRETAADEWAAGTMGDRGSYAKALLEIIAERCTTGAPPRGSIAMADYRSPEARIHHILSADALRTESRTFRGLLTTATLFAGLLLGGISFAQQQHDKPKEAVRAAPETSEPEPVYETLRVTGEVVDSDGNPIAGAKIIHGFAQQRSFADENGRYELELELIPLTRRVAEITWFHASGRAWRSAWLTFGGDGASVIEDESGQKHLKDFRITLPKSSRLEVLVLDPDGQPIPNATVVPNRVHVPNGSRLSDIPAGLIYRLPDELEARITRTTGTDGRVELDEIPKGLVYSLRVTSNDFGEQIIQIPKGSTSTRVNALMRPVATIAGDVTGNRSAFAGGKVYVTTKAYYRRGQRNSSEATATIGNDGKFFISTVAALDELEFRFFGARLKEQNLSPVFSWDGSLSAGRQLNVRLSGVPLRQVDGRLMTEDTKEPIPESRISFHSATSPGTYVSALTDEQGRFSARLPDGEVKAQVTAVAGELGRRYDHRVQPRVFKVHHAPVKQTFFLRPKRTLTGKLVAQTGEPIGGATIGLRNMGAESRPGRLSYPTATDADGEFTMWVDWVDLTWIRDNRGFSGNPLWFMQTEKQKGVRPAQLQPLDAKLESGNRVLLTLP